MLLLLLLFSFVVSVDLCCLSCSSCYDSRTTQQTHLNRFSNDCGPIYRYRAPNIPECDAERRRTACALAPARDAIALFRYRRTHGSIISAIRSVSLVTVDVLLPLGLEQSRCAAKQVRRLLRAEQTTNKQTTKRQGTNETYPSRRRQRTNESQDAIIIIIIIDDESYVVTIIIDTYRWRSERHRSPRRRRRPSRRASPRADRARARATPPAHTCERQKGGGGRCGLVVIDLRGGFLDRTTQVRRTRAEIGRQ